MCFKEINPDEIRAISKCLIADALKKEIYDSDFKMTRADFGKLLDTNPIIRSIILRSINPQVWAGSNLPEKVLSWPQQMSFKIS